MPTFDVVSELDMQEVKNAVDQASREVGTRFDFKGTDTTIELSGEEIKLASATEDRLKAALVVVEEKLVKRGVSLKGIEHGKVEDAAKSTVRQSLKLLSGINQEKAKAVNKHIKECGVKGLSSQTQGATIRVTSKKRDDLQACIESLKSEDFGIPLQFENFRD